MGFATVFASVMFAFIFASMIIFAAVVQKNMTEASRLEHERDERAALNSGMDLAITDSNYILNGSVAWRDNLYADFEQGTTVNTTLLGAGSLTLNDTGGQYLANGTYTSQVIDTGVATPSYTTLAWTSVLPGSTSITFQARSGDSVAALEATSFTGPTGTTTDYYTISGGNLNETHRNDRYFQYRAYLNTSNAAQTPELQQVTVTIYRGTGVIYLNATNTGSVKLTPSATDVYIDGQRISRNMTQRTYALDDTGGQALWDPGEIIELQVFRTLSGAAQATVANSAAQTSTVVN